MLAVRTSTFNISKVQLNKFVILYGVPNGYQIQIQQANSSILLPGSQQPILQNLMILKPNEGPFQMRLQVSFLYGSQPFTETVNVFPNVFT
jgi:hypothetical protein